MILWDYTAQYLGASHNPLEILQPVSRGRGEANTVATHFQGSHPHGPVLWIRRLQRPGPGGHERSTRGDLHRHRVSGGVFVEATMVGTRSYKQDTLQSIKIWNTHDLSIIFWTGKPWVSISMLICQRVTRDTISWGTSITKVFPSALPNYRTAHQEIGISLSFPAEGKNRGCFQRRKRQVPRSTWLIWCQWPSGNNYDQYYLAHHDNRLITYQYRPLYHKAF